MKLFEKLNKFSEHFEISESVTEYIDYTIDSWRDTNSNDIFDFLIDANTSRNFQSSEGSTYVIFDKINNEIVKEDINDVELKEFINQWFKNNNLE